MNDIKSETITGGRPGSGAHRVVALCGPYLSGKTSLLESILYATGAIGRRGSTRAGTSIGDGAAEARKRGMGTEINVASVDYLGDQWTFLDVPGSIEFQHDAFAALAVCDAAVLVCEPSPERVVALTPLLKFIEDHHIPHIIFVNKIDSAEVRVRDMLAALQSHLVAQAGAAPGADPPAAADGSEETVGYVDLVSERAYRYKSSGASDLIEMPAEILPRESEARREMLETLSEFDDKLLEQLIEDIAPEKSLIYRDLHDEFGADLIVPVLLGAGDRENGVRRLLKALRHDTPFVAETAKRRSLPSNGVAMAECFKVLHQSHAGKLSLCRVWSGSLVEGQSVGGQRIGTLLRPFGQRLDKISEAKAGEIVALAKVDALSAGQSLAAAGIAATADFPKADTPVFALSLRGQEPQRRGQALGRPAQDRRGGSVALLRSARRDPRAADQGPGRDASEGRGRQARRPLQRRGRDRRRRAWPIARPSRAAASSTPATSARPAAMASSPTSRSRSSRCRAARASASSTRSWAAWCRATSSPPSRKA